MSSIHALPWVSRSISAEGRDGGCDGDGGCGDGQSGGSGEGGSGCGH